MQNRDRDRDGERGNGPRWPGTERKMDDSETYSRNPHTNRLDVSGFSKRKRKRYNKRRRNSNNYGGNNTAYENGRDRTGYTNFPPWNATTTQLPTINSQYGSVPFGSNNNTYGSNPQNTQFYNQFRPNTQKETVIGSGRKDMRSKSHDEYNDFESEFPPLRTMNINQLPKLPVESAFGYPNDINTIKNHEPDFHSQSTQSLTSSSQSQIKSQMNPTKAEILIDESPQKSSNERKRRIRKSSIGNEDDNEGEKIVESDNESDYDQANTSYTSFDTKKNKLSTIDWKKFNDKTQNKFTTASLGSKLDLEDFDLDAVFDTPENIGDDKSNIVTEKNVRKVKLQPPQLDPNFSTAIKLGKPVKSMAETKPILKKLPVKPSKVVKKQNDIPHVVLERRRTKIKKPMRVDDDGRGEERREKIKLERERVARETEILASREREEKERLENDASEKMETAEREKARMKQEHTVTKEKRKDDIRMDMMKRKEARRELLRKKTEEVKKLIAEIEILQADEDMDTVSSTDESTDSSEEDENDGLVEDSSDETLTKAEELKVAQLVSSDSDSDSDSDDSDLDVDRMLNNLDKVVRETDDTQMTQVPHTVAANESIIISDSENSSDSDSDSDSDVSSSSGEDIIDFLPESGIRKETQDAGFDIHKVEQNKEIDNTEGALTNQQSQIVNDNSLIEESKREDEEQHSPNTSLNSHHDTSLFVNSDSTGSADNYADNVVEAKPIDNDFEVPDDGYFDNELDTGSNNDMKPNESLSEVENSSSHINPSLIKNEVENMKNNVGTSLFIQDDSSDSDDFVDAEEFVAEKPENEAVDSGYEDESIIIPSKRREKKLSRSKAEKLKSRAEKLKNKLKSYTPYSSESSSEDSSESSSDDEIERRKSTQNFVDEEIHYDSDVQSLDELEEIEKKLERQKKMKTYGGKRKLSTSSISNAEPHQGSPVVIDDGSESESPRKRKPRRLNTVAALNELAFENPGKKIALFEDDLVSSTNRSRRAVMKANAIEKTTGKTTEKIEESSEQDTEPKSLVNEDGKDGNMKIDPEVKSNMEAFQVTRPSESTKPNPKSTNAKPGLPQDFNELLHMVTLGKQKKIQDEKKIEEKKLEEKKKLTEMNVNTVNPHAKPKRNWRDQNTIDLDSDSDDDEIEIVSEKFIPRIKGKSKKQRILDAQNKRAASKKAAESGIARFNNNHSNSNRG